MLKFYDTLERLNSKADSVAKSAAKVAPRIERKASAYSSEDEEVDNRYAGVASKLRFS